MTLCAVTCKNVCVPTVKPSSLTAHIVMVIVQTHRLLAWCVAVTLWLYISIHVCVLCMVSSGVTSTAQYYSAGCTHGVDIRVALIFLIALCALNLCSMHMLPALGRVVDIWMYIHWVCRYMASRRMPGHHIYRCQCCMVYCVTITLCHGLGMHTGHVPCWIS